MFTGRRLFARVGVDCAIAVAVLVVLGPIVSENSAQPASRYALTAALAEHRSVDITRYDGSLGIDYSVHDGLRSDKAPGQPMFAVPAYAAARVAGAESASVRRVTGNLTLWWLTLWSSTVPFALLLIVLRRTIARIAPSAALPVTLAFAGGALVLPYSVNLYGHVLGALLGFTAWSILEADPGSPRRILLSGFVVGTAVFVEYETAIIAAVLMVFVFVRARRSTLFYVAGGMPWAIGLAAYEWAAFGAPWRFPYEFYVGKLHRSADMGLHNPLSAILDMVIGRHGFVVTAPLVLVAALVAVSVLRGRDRRVRDHAAIALWVLVGYVLVVGTFAGSDLSQIPGPRFVIPALPFLMVPLAVRYREIRAPVIATAAWGAALTIVSVWTTLVIEPNALVIQALSDFVRTRHFAPTLWSIGLGRFGPVVYFGSAALAIGLLVRVATARPAAAPGAPIADREELKVGV